MGALCGVFVLCCDVLLVVLHTLFISYGFDMYVVLARSYVV